MNFQITIFGVAIAAVFYGICAALLMPLWRAKSGSMLKKCTVVALAVIAVILPWADEIYIASRFADLCRDAGVHVYKKVTVEGFLDSTGTKMSADSVRVGAIRTLDDRGREEFRYRFKESPLRDGRIWRLERLGNQLSASILDRPSAEFMYRRPVEDQQVAYQITKTEYQVVDMSNERVIGRRTFYKRYPGWLEGLWIRFLGTGMTMCPDPESSQHQPAFPDVVLAPAKTS